MHRRLIGAAGVALAVLGCNEDPARTSVVAEAAPPPPSPRPDDAGPKIPPLLAARDDKPASSSKGDKTPGTAKELVQKGVEAAQKNDLVAASNLFEQAVKLDPADRQALFFLTLTGQIHAGQMAPGKEQMAAFLRSSGAARKLRDAAKEPTAQEKGIIAQALFNEACAFAKDKQDDKALASLTEAVDAGLAEDRALADEADLASIRSRPEFPKLVARVKAAATKAAEERDAAMTKQILPEVQAELKGFKSFPFTFALADVDGKAVKLDDFKGKVTIVDIWGTWCPPCRLEVPHFVKVRANFKDKGVEVVGINYARSGQGESKALIVPFVKENGVTYPCVIGDEKTLAQVPDFSGYPTTLFLDRAGKVRYKHMGYAPYEVLEYLVKALLDDKPATP